MPITDIVLDPPVDAVTLLTSTWLNANVRDALNLCLQPPTCLLQKTNTQTVAAGPTAWTAVQWNTLISDTEDPATPMFNAGANTRVTIRTPGWYECSFAFSHLVDTGGNGLTTAFQINGSAIYVGDTAEWPTGNVNHVSDFATMMPFNASDYVEAIVRTSRAAALSSINLWALPKLSVRRVRGL